MREAGFYWIKICSDWQWQVAEYCSEVKNMFLVSGEESWIAEEDVDEIYETRILTPDEQLKNKL